MLQHQALALRHFLGTVELKEPLKNVKVTDVLPPIRLTASRPDVTPFTVTQVSPTPIRPGGATRGPLTVVLSWGSNELVSGNEAVFDGDVKSVKAQLEAATETWFVDCRGASTPAPRYLWKRTLMTEHKSTGRVADLPRPSPGLLWTIDKAKKSYEWLDATVHPMPTTGVVEIYMQRDAY